MNVRHLQDIQFTATRAICSSDFDLWIAIVSAQFAERHLAFGETESKQSRVHVPQGLPHAPRSRMKTLSANGSAVGRAEVKYSSHLQRTDLRVRQKFVLNMKSRAPKPGFWLMRGAQPATSPVPDFLPEEPDSGTLHHPAKMR
jgi:hypothetical protein